MSIVILIGCKPRPTGISGVVKAANDVQVENLELHVIELYEQESGKAVQVFIEGETIAKPVIDSQGRFEALIHPGEYVLEVFSAEGDLLTSRRIRVKRNKMTHVELERSGHND